MKTSRLAPVLLGGARLCAATTSTLQRCRHYAARRKPQRTGRQGREGIYSPTVAQKAAAPVERRAAAAEEQPRDTGITVIGSAALAVAVMGGCTLAYRFYTFGEASKPAEPLDAGQATSPPITVRVRRRGARRAASPAYSFICGVCRHRRRRCPRPSERCCRSECCGSQTTHGAGRHSGAAAQKPARARFSDLARAVDEGPGREAARLAMGCCHSSGLALSLNGGLGCTTALESYPAATRPPGVWRGRGGRWAQRRALRAVGAAAAAAGHGAAAVERLRVEAVAALR